MREGAYVRIRGCTLYNFANKGYERTFGMRPQSNVLSLPYPSKLAQEMMFDEFSAKNEFEVKSLTINPTTMMHPIIISRINEKELAWKHLTDLNRLNEDAKVIEKEVVHRVRVSVISTGLTSSSPDSLKECVRIYDQKTGKSRAADAKSTLKGKNEHFVFSLPIYVKDTSTRHSAKVNIMHIVDDSTDGKTGFFPGLSVTDLLKNKVA